MGLFLALTFLRLLVSFKITRLFGPFIKVFLLSFSSIFLLALTTYLLLLPMSNFLNILLQ